MTARFAGVLLERESATVVYYNAKHLEPFRGTSRFTIRELDDPALEHRSAIVTLGRGPAGSERPEPLGMLADEAERSRASARASAGSGGAGR